MSMTNLVSSYLILCMGFGSFAHAIEQSKITGSTIEAVAISANSVKLKPVKLDPNGLSELKQFQHSQEEQPPNPLIAAIAPRKRPVPTWEAAKTDNKHRIFPVLSDGERIYVSLYGDGFSVSKSIEDELTRIYKEKGTPETFEINGDLVRKILSELRIEGEEAVYWFLFDERKNRQRTFQDIKTLLIKANPASDSVFGTIGIELSQSKDAHSLLGIAYIGKHNLLQPGNAAAPQWRSAQQLIDPGKVKQMADYIAPVGPSESRAVSEFPKFQSIRLGETEFIQALAKFDRKASADQPRFTETMYGFFLKEKDQVFTLYDFNLDTDYFQMPSQILIGNWIAGYEGVLYISSTGMSDCGRFVLVKTGTQSTVVPVRCGSWGC